MDLKERLRLIDSLRAKQSNSLNHHRKAADAYLENQVPSFGVARLGNSFGTFSYLEKDYPLDYIHGDMPLASCLEKSFQHLALLGKLPECESVDFKKILFFDTETTGLSGGAGTCAFLVGVGYFTESGFRLGQYFMNDFDEEAALIYELNELIEQFELLVSYNGKPFDAPILNSRNIYQGFKSPLPDILHFDLLFTVRRLWKHKLPDCSLSTAESLIQFYRNNDIPGYLIPYLYSEYLRNKDTKPLQPIFHHNRMDIVSMVALLTKAIETVEQPFESCREILDILAIGKIYEDTVRYEQSIELYEKFLDTTFDRIHRRDLLFRIAYNHKKLNNWAKAAKVWQECLRSEAFHPLPYVELAKHYEHRQREHAKALEIVEKALAELDIVNTLRPHIDLNDYRENLEYRKKRLLRKLA